MKRILIEGWRGVHQSLAMVNQYQILELAKLDGIELRHRDLPFSSPNWNRPENASGFHEAKEFTIKNVPPPAEGETFDVAYRIAMPFARSTAPAKQRITFIVSEFGLRNFQFLDPELRPDRLCSDGDLVVTPSNWSKMKLVEYGIPESGIRVVPHGVCSDVFYPMLPDERIEIRGELDIAEDEFVFLNVGSLTLEKGVDLLIRAFVIVVQRHPKARLMLKDTSGLYGLTIEEFIVKYADHFGPIPREVLDAMWQVPSSLSLSEMRRLYGSADVYVSPYRAEGFNLPVIEAIACGTPAIVTRGGATDDFCDDRTTLLVDADCVSNFDREFYGNTKLPGYHLEPIVDSLIDQMESALKAPIASRPSFLEARKRFVERNSWSNHVRNLTELF